METVIQKNSSEGRRYHLRHGGLKTFVTWWRWIASLLIVLSVLPLFSTPAKNRSDDTLIQVNVLFRHGERTPREIYPKDPFQKDDWPEGLDQLTLKGKTHMYRLGRHLRELYTNLLGVTPHFSSIHMESSAAERCLMSAEAVLAGLMPPVSDMRLHPDLPWQPVPVHHRPPEHDPVLMSLKTCPRFDRMLKEAFGSPAIREIDRQNRKLYDYLSEHTGKEVKNLTDVKLIYDTLVCERSNGLTLPTWTELVFPKKLQFLSAKARSLNTFNDAMKRLKGGPFFLRLRDRLREKAKSPHLRTGKMFLYAAHDQTLVDVVRSMGFTEMFEVDFGSSLMFELHQDRNDSSSFTISVLYYNMLALLHPKHLLVPGCGKACSLETFLKILEPKIPPDWDKECQLDYKDSSSRPRGPKVAERKPKSEEPSEGGRKSLLSSTSP